MKTSLLTTARHVNDSVPVASTVARLVQAGPLRHDVLTVLTYHRIAGDDEVVPPGIRSATPEGFDAHMRLVRERFTPISAEELLAISAGEARLPAGAVHVTFDDAYRDFATLAWPVLRRLDIPVSLFVPTAYPGGDRDFWWDRLHRAFLQTSRSSVGFDGQRWPLGDRRERLAAYRGARAVVKATPHHRAMGFVDSVVDELSPTAEAPPSGTPTATTLTTEVGADLPAHLDWADLATLADEGVDLAPHSHSHALFDRIEPDQLDEELARPRRILADKIGRCLPMLAYPGGQLDDTVIAAADRAGYRVAFSTQRGVNRLGGVDWLNLRRLNVGQNTTAPAITTQVLAYGLRSAWETR